MKRFSVAVLFFLAVLLYNGNAYADAAAAIVIEAKTGRVLYAHNEAKPLPMASTTKIMTALIALENCDLDEIVRTGKNAFGVPGTSIYLEAGEELTMGQMLYGLMLASGNDAAVAIAEHVAGSVEDFCTLMNARAQQIGCMNTHFVTPHGLPADQHYTTAHDLALITRQAMQNPVFRQIVSSQRATIPWMNHPYERVLTNKNRLLSTYNGALGVKTGYTRAAGRCLAFSAERDGLELIGIVLNSPDWFEQAARLLDQTFSNFEMHTALESGTVVRTLPVSGGVLEEVDVIVSEDVAAPILKGSQVQLMISLPDTLEAGFEQDAQVGWMALESEGETLCSVPLITANGVEKRSFQTCINREIANWLFTIL